MIVTSLIVSDLTCDETMSSADEAEKKDSRFVFQQPVSMPFARVASMMPNVAVQPNSRHFLKTYIRNQTGQAVPVGCPGATQKILHAHTAAPVLPAAQCTAALPGRSKVVTLRPAGIAHTYLKPYDIAQLNASSMTTVYLQQQQQQHNLHVANVHQPVVPLSSPLIHDFDESHAVRPSTATFANFDSYRHLAGRNVGVCDVPVQSSVRLNPVLNCAPAVLSSRASCKLATKDFLRSTRFVTQISEGADIKSIMMPLPTVNLTCTSVAQSITTLNNTCIAVAAAQHDNNMGGMSYPGPSARPTILRRNRESSINSTVRRLIVAEAHPQLSSKQEVLAGTGTAMKDDANSMYFKHSTVDNSRLLNETTCLTSDTSGIYTRAPAILIGSVIPGVENYSNQIGVSEVTEISPRKRMRKQNFECSNAEKMKLLINADQVIGNSFVGVNDELTWKSANIDVDAQAVDSSFLSEKIPKRRGRARVDNGAVTASGQHCVSLPLSCEISSDCDTGLKSKKKQVTRSKLPVLEAQVVGPTLENLQSGNFNDEGHFSSQNKQVRRSSMSVLGEHMDEKLEETERLRKLEDVAYLMYHVFGLGMSVSDNLCSKSQQIGDGSSNVSTTAPLSFDEDQTSRSESPSISDEYTFHTTCCDSTELKKEKEPVESTSVDGAENALKIQDNTEKYESESRQADIEARKILIQMLRSCVLKDRWQRLDRISSSERVFKRIYMKRWLLQQHFRSPTKELAVPDTELQAQMIDPLETYSILAAEKQSKRLLDKYPVCSPSTSDILVQENVNCGFSNSEYLKESLEIYTHSSDVSMKERRHVVLRRSFHSDVRLPRNPRSVTYISRRDPETEILQAVAEALAEIIEVVIQEDEKRFGTSAFPLSFRQASYDSVIFYDSISRYDFNRKRKPDAIDSDDALFTDIEQDLHRKKKRFGGSKDLSRTLQSKEIFSHLRSAHQRLSDLRKAEEDNIEEATEQMLTLVEYSDPPSYSNLKNGHEEVCLPDCQSLDNVSDREEKCQKQLLSFTRAVSPRKFSFSKNYEPHSTMMINPPMNYTVKLFQEKFVYPPKRFRMGSKRMRKTQYRRGRGRQRGNFSRIREELLTPEPQLEDLKPHFTADELSTIFNKECEMNPTSFSQEQSIHSSEEGTIDMDSIKSRAQSQSLININRENSAKEVEDLDQSEKTLKTVSEELETLDGNYAISLENENNGGHLDSSFTAPLINSISKQEIGLLEHIQVRGQHIREHFSTLLHALRSSDILTAKAIRLFRDSTVELFDRENESVG
ncbi:unnamed protein product [Thelazia callipaeda]|uniref:SAM domain-containing protein n=1 Tax=Thelazia callipaeda TaxID=103827 RepID=A0A0N5DAA5_THECL|nr:unnamed protein product [Thelazia callipaeda]